MEQRLMTEREKADIIMKSLELEKAGRKEEALNMRKAIPMPAYLAKIFKEKVGADFLIQTGRNLAEAEVAYGSGWLAR